MTAIDDRPPREGFRLEQLWNDSRYRSTFIQVVALFLTITALFLIVQNVLANLEALGKTLGFDFMNEPASYDINQSLLDYSSRDSHARAAVIGIINTLLVAVVGCFLATVVGVLAGIARLSRNWLLRAVMTVYVEGFRNIPVLIWILLVAALINESAPVPRDFRGDEPDASMWLFGSVAVTNRGVYLPAPVMEAGSWIVVAALILGVVAAVVFGRWARDRQMRTGEILPVLPIKAGIVLGAPLLAFLLAGLPIGLDLPEIRTFNFQGGIYARDSYVALTLALALYTGAFIAENVRAGVQAVAKGQTEAAAALGLQPGRVMSLVVLPQALRMIIPPMISQYLNLTKNSSLALLVGYMDVTGTLMGITLNQTGREFETLFLGMAVYLTISLSIAAVMNLYDENKKLVERSTVFGGGLSLRAPLDRLFGNETWRRVSKGDALMRADYGIRREMNLLPLFYGLWLALLLHYVFLEGTGDAKTSYWVWDTTTRIGALVMMIAAFGAFLTCVFKNGRFLDFAIMEFAAFALAILFGFHFGLLIDGVSGTVLVAVTAAMRLAIIGYVMLGRRPNLTFFHRLREG
ncbi:MAG: amino acid ABC transporter permease [Paracoccaceae bacterium]